MDWVRVCNKVLVFSSVKIIKMTLAIAYGIILARLFTLSLSLSLSLQFLFGVERMFLIYVCTLPKLLYEVPYASLQSFQIIISF